jgi:predicted Zn-dependent protease
MASPLADSPTEPSKRKHIPFWDKTSIVLAAALIIVVVVFLAFVPVESSNFAFTKNMTCNTLSGCSSLEYTVGDWRYATVGGVWWSTSPVSVEVKTPSNINYHVASSGNGSFSVSGYGPFEIIVTINPTLGPGSTVTTAVAGIIDTTVV